MNHYTKEVMFLLSVRKYYFGRDCHSSTDTHGRPTCLIGDQDSSLVHSFFRSFKKWLGYNSYLLVISEEKLEKVANMHLIINSYIYTSNLHESTYQVKKYRSCYPNFFRTEKSLMIVDLNHD